MTETTGPEQPGSLFPDLPPAAPKLGDLLGKRITVTNPDNGSAWTGTLLGYGSTPCMTIRRDADGENMCLPQAFSFAEADQPPVPDPAPLPPGEYARVEILGHDSHTGWVTESTRAGQPVMVIRNWDGFVIAEVPGHSLYRFVPLATPLKRPEPAAAIGPPAGWREDWDSSEDAVYDDDEEPF